MMPCTRRKRSRPAAAAATSRVLFATTCSALCASSVRAFDAPSAAAACVAGQRARSRSSRSVMRAMPDWSSFGIGKLPKKTSHARASCADADAEHSGHEVTSLGAFGNFTKTSSAWLSIDDEAMALRRSSSLVSTPSSSSAQASEPVRFSFFERRDGSKRYYRTGKPLVAWTKLNGENQSDNTPEQHVNNVLSAINPFKVRANGESNASKQNGPWAFFRK